MKQSIQNSIFILIAAFSGSAEASLFDPADQTECVIVVGDQCSGERIYSMKMCRQITLNGGECQDLCKAQKPVCNVEDFSPWVSAFQKKGVKSVTGSLVDLGDIYDADGVLATTSEKTLSVCRRNVTALSVGGWKKVSQATCPKSEVATPDSCVAGTSYDADTQQCVTVDADGSTGAGDYNNMVNQSQLMTAVQNQHFGTDSSIDNTAYQAAATGSQMPGLSAPTKNSGSSGLAQDMNFQSANNAASGSKGPSTNNGSNSNSGNSIGAPGAGNALSAKDQAASTDALIASAGLGNSGSSYGSGSGSGSGSSAGAGGSGASWFGAGNSAATAGGISGELSYGKDGKKGEDGDASRGLASAAGILKIEDPANYFMMSDIQVSLFKRVTAVCRKKERALVLK